MRLSPRRLVLLPTLLAGLLALCPTVARPQPPQPREDRRARLSGAWRLEQTHDQAQARIDEAIDQAVNAMNFLIRGIARGRLREGTPIHERIELEVREDDRVTVRFDRRESYTTRLGRTEVATNPNGERMRVTQRLRSNGALEQSFATDGGTRKYLYTPLGNGRLRVTTTTTSPHMPRPMFFFLEYHRG